MGQEIYDVSLEHLAVPETKEGLKNTTMAIYQRDIRAKESFSKRHLMELQMAKT